MFINLLFFLLGLLAGGLINILADDLPQRRRPRRPRCAQCNRVYGPAGWLAVGRLLSGRRHCLACGAAWPHRAWLVEIGTAFLFAGLPSLISEPRNLAVYTLYAAILILIIVIDLERRLILHVVTLPTTVLAIFPGSLIVSDSGFLLALIGALTGFLILLAFYWLGQWLFGPGALGFGDVTLAMTMGAMLGFHRILFAVILGVFLAGLSSLLLILLRRVGLRSRIAYGPYLAAAGMVMLLWGNQVLDWYIM